MAWSGYATDKQVDKLFEKHINIAKSWFAKGFTAEQISNGIWNKFGRQCETVNKTTIKTNFQYNGKGCKPQIIEIDLSK